jgi:glyoxylase I family protein
MISIQHISLNCKDRNISEHFYSKHFGFRRARVFNQGQPNEFVMLRLGGCCIELFPAKPEAVPAHGGEQPVGFKHLAFEVPDIQATVKQLEEDGVKTEGIIDCNDICKGLKVCFFVDPDGNRLELMQGYTDQFQD